MELTVDDVEIVGGTEIRTDLGEGSFVNDWWELDENFDDCRSWDELVECPDVCLEISIDGFLSRLFDDDVEMFPELVRKFGEDFRLDGGICLAELWLFPISDDLLLAPCNA